MKMKKALPKLVTLLLIVVLYVAVSLLFGESSPLSYYAEVVKLILILSLIHIFLLSA